MYKILLLLFSNCMISESTETVTLPTSCIGLNDGYHYIKLLVDDIENNIQYPIIYALCSNDYVIIDYSIDYEWSLYFTSWIKYHYGVVGPIRNDKSNWSKWFLPDNNNNNNHIAIVNNYLVSPSCTSCDISSDIQLNGVQSSYYMSALAFGCFNTVRGWPACDFDYNSYQCFICEWDSALTQISSSPRPQTLTWEDVIDQNLKTGICNFEIRSSTQSVSQSFTKCATIGKQNTNWKPSLGIDHRFCQCYKPYRLQNYIDSITLEKNRLQNKIKIVLQQNVDHDTSTVLQETNDIKSKIHRLFASDFAHGTYRIGVPGTYVIMEDIEFNFNAAPAGHESPNNIHDNYWWPTDNVLYPGAMGSRDAFFLGFFAGITIECDNVVVDLNGYELRMSDIFYYQQPFFSIIELSSQPFLPQQGPGLFGADPYFANNVVIKNGIIGLSSHHGIHGNNNNNIDIIEVKVKDFQTHGIQLNGFNDLTVLNTDIGPSSTKAYLNGNYGQMRLLLPKMSHIAEQHSTDYIQFNGRTLDKQVTLQDLVDKVVKMMDMVLDYVMNGVTVENDKYWNEAVEIFINPSGLPFGAVLYGLFLNYPSAGIFGWHVNDEHSYNVNLENVYIHNLRHKGIEVVGLAQNGRVICNAFNGPIPAQDIFGAAQIKSFRERAHDDIFSVDYVGSIISDIHIGMYYFGRDDFDNWAGIPFYGFNDKIIDWSMGKLPQYMSSFNFNREEFGFYCNEDAMFHPAKGLLAVKISGVKNVTIKNIQINKLQDETLFGSNLCGEITEPQHGLYHFAQQLPYQVGFSMNMVMGITIDFSSVNIENIHVENLFSKTGLVYGFAAWFESDINMNGELFVNNLNAGFGRHDNGLSYDDLPNKAAEVCSIRLFDDDNYPLTINWNVNQYQTCIYGDIGCLGDNNHYTHFKRINNYGCQKNKIKQPFELAPNSFNELLQSQTSLILKYDNDNNMMAYNNPLIGLVFIAIFIFCLCIIKMMFGHAMRNNKMENQNNFTELTRLIQS